MKTTAVQVSAILLTICWTAITLANELILPEPQRFVTCDNEHPKSIVGVWGQDFLRTNIANGNQDSLTNTVIQGDPDEASQSAGTLTITNDTFSFLVPGMGEIRRDYEIVGGSANRYSVELSDKQGATLVIAMESAPCGLIMEQHSPCHAQFCLNTIEEIMRSLKPQPDDIEAIIQKTIEASTSQPESLSRLFYRRLSDG